MSELINGLIDTQDFLNKWDIVEYMQIQIHSEETERMSDAGVLRRAEGVRTSLNQKRSYL